jgi:ABC-2 type transport system ATP-binding protein
LRSTGRAVLVSTHNLAEAEQLADRIAILKTRLIAFDTPEALRSARGGSRLVVDVEGAAPLTIAIGSVTDVPDVVARLVMEGKRITRVVTDHRSLEEAYLDLVEGRQ